MTIPAWKCYSTGKNPGKLGVFWFAYPDFSERTLQFNLPGHIGGNLWDYIPNSVVINTPGTFPPRTIDGVMIAGHPCPDDQPFVTPPWAAQRIGEYRVNSHVHASDPGFPDEAMKLISSRFDLFHQYASRFDFGQVTVFYIDELHHFYGSDSIVLDAWRLIDEEIGQIMEIADNVVLVSDHGSGPLRNFANVVPALRAVDAFRLRRNPWRKWSAAIWHVASVAPAAYRAVGERVIPPKLKDSVRVRLRPMHDLLPTLEQFQARVDWSSPIVPLNQGLIYRNPRSRREDVAISDVMEALRSIPGVARLWRREELYSGPLLASSPDVWVEGEPDVEITARYDENWETKSPEKGTEWIVNHRMDGMFGFLGKDVGHIDVERASIYDMCPTILFFFGIRAPPSVDGTALPVVRGSPGRSTETGSDPGA